MEIVVGPVPMASARAWLDYAERALAHLRTVRDDTELPAAALDAFGELIDEWRRIAKGDEAFRWVSEEPPERAEYLLSSLFHAGNVLEREAGAGRHGLRPAEADAFHLQLISSVLVALRAEGPPYTQFAEQMRSAWGIGLG